MGPTRGDSEQISIRPSPPYRISPHLEAYCLSGEPLPCVYESGAKRLRLLAGVGGSPRPLSVSIRSEGQFPLLQVQVAGGEDSGRGARSDAQSIASWVMSVDVDYMEFMRRTEGTPLHSLAWRSFGLRPARATGVYEALLIALAWGQEKPLRALAALVRRTSPSSSARGEQFYGPPDPAAVAALGIEGLKSLGFSQQKAEAVLEVSAAAASGSLPSMEEASSNPRRAARAFAELRGVGRSAAELAASLVSKIPWGGHSPEAAARRISELLGSGYAARDVENVLGDYLGLAYYLVEFAPSGPSNP
jgi:3-methyladenine DNA glycosylase/8-oxoguanine DNA glycosylase